MLDPYLVIGEISKPQGVRGELKVRPATADVQRFAQLEYIFLNQGGQMHRRNASVSRIESDAVYMFLDGVSDRNEAEKFRGQLLYIDRENALQLPEDTDFICDLIGCVATDDEGRLIGTLQEVLQNGAADVYVFRGSTLGEVMVPALKDLMLSVDVANKKIVMSATRLAEVAVFED